MNTPLKIARNCVIATLTLFATARADQTVSFPEKKPALSIAFPDAWKVTTDEDSVSASSPDDLVNMELAALDAEGLDSAIEDAKEGLEEELKGIKWDEPEQGDINGMKVTVLNGAVTIEGLKMTINCAVFEPAGAEKFFMLFNIVPIDALEKHGADVGKVLQSIKSK